MILGILHRYFVTVTKKAKMGPKCNDVNYKRALASEMVR